MGSLHAGHSESRAVRPLTRAEEGKRLDLFRGHAVRDERVRASVGGRMLGELHRWSAYVPIV